MCILIISGGVSESCNMTTQFPAIEITVKANDNNQSKFNIVFSPTGREKSNIVQIVYVVYVRFLE